MNKQSISNLKTTLGLAVVSSSLAAPLAMADTNPFAATDLGAGYQLAEKHVEGKCGEDKAAKDSEGKCGEGKCGEDKAAKDTEGKCGEDKAASKDAEGKCGEGKCGEDKAAGGEAE